VSKLGLHGKLVARPGERDALVEVLLEAANVLADVPECERFVVSTTATGADAVWVTELWTSEGRARPIPDER
jgi:quinol monooxygenase YgiN